jgi:hypothetical protein
MGLSFTIAAGPRLRSHSQVRVPRDSWSPFTVSDSRVPQPGGPGPRIYIPQEQRGPVIPPGTGFPLHHLLRLAGLRWRCSTPPPHGKTVSILCYITSGRTDRKHLSFPYPRRRLFITQRRVGFQESFSTETSVYHSAMDCFQESISSETCSPTLSLAMGLHVTIWRRMTGRIVNSDLGKKIWKEAFMASLRYYPTFAW